MSAFAVDPSFFIADNDAASQTFAISGTTIAGTTRDHVDVNCYRGSQVSTVAANVAVNSDGSFKKAFSKEVKKGRVISSNPKAGKHVAYKAKVALTVSKGRKPKK